MQTVLSATVHYFLYFYDPAFILNSVGNWLNCTNDGWIFNFSECTVYSLFVFTFCFFRKMYIVFVFFLMKIKNRFGSFSWKNEKNKMKTLPLLFTFFIFFFLVFQHILGLSESNFPFLRNKNFLLFPPGKTNFESSYWECFQTNNTLKAAVGLLLNWFPTFSQAHIPNVVITEAACHYCAILYVISPDNMQWYWHL